MTISCLLPSDLLRTLHAMAEPASTYATDAPVLTVQDVLLALSGQAIVRADGVVEIDTTRGQ